VQPGGAEAPLAVFGYFFEFQPLSGGAPLLAHQLQDGEEYGLIITSYSGLYRYNLHDIVRVKGFTGQTPNILFVSKTRDVANLAGEKLSGAFISDLVRQTLAAANRPWRHFCVVADSDAHRYDFCIEPDGDQPPDADWLRTIDARLIAEAAAYQVLRGQGLIQPPRLRIMQSGWLGRLYEQHLRPGVTTSQIKLPLVCAAVPQPEMVVRSVEL
jgi:hypothetical protein